MDLSSEPGWKEQMTRYVAFVPAPANRDSTWDYGLINKLLEVDPQVLVKPDIFFWKHARISVVGKADCHLSKLS